MDDVISEEYRVLQRELHDREAGYGSASVRYAPRVAHIIQQHRLVTVLDYGAGKRRLELELLKLGVEPLCYSAYDPAFPEYGEPLERCDLIACIDVLEHVEPDRLGAVLRNIRALAQPSGLIFASVACGPAAKVLADGRNAHLIQRDYAWWFDRFREMGWVTVSWGGNVGADFWVLMR
jgi:hypothetical protein